MTKELTKAESSAMTQDYLDNLKSKPSGKSNSAIYGFISILLVASTLTIAFLPSTRGLGSNHFNNYYMKNIDFSDKKFRIGTNMFEDENQENYSNLYQKLYGNNIVFSNEELKDLFDNCKRRTCGTIHVPSTLMLRELAIKNDKVDLFDSITLAYLNQVAESKNNLEQPYKFELADTNKPDCDKSGHCVTGVHYTNVLYKD